MGAVDKSLRVTPQEEAGLIAQIKKADFHEPDLASELLGEGLWLAYALMALIWFRRVMRRRTARWLLAVQRRVVAPMVARQTARGLALVTRQRQPAPIFSEPAAART
ncbi:MAG TPA: hypothetical protein VEI07_07450 [Planctomycetaceae bacterium]|nr:hypothetical protein [Planctomycetaceae bacterium]